MGDKLWEKTWSSGVLEWWSIAAMEYWKGDFWLRPSIDVVVKNKLGV